MLKKFSSQKSVRSAYLKDGSYRTGSGSGENGRNLNLQTEEGVGGWDGRGMGRQLASDRPLCGNTEAMGKRQVNKLESELHMELILFTVMIYMDNIFFQFA